MNDRMELVGCVLHKLEKSLVTSISLACHNGMGLDHYVICTMCKGEISCYSSSGGYPFMQLFLSHEMD